MMRKGKKTAQGSANPSPTTTGSSTPLSRPAHALSVDQIIEEISTSPINGLSEDEARTRLGQFGRNEFQNSKGITAMEVMVRQLVNAMSLVSTSLFPVALTTAGVVTDFLRCEVLFMAMAASFGIQSWIEGAFIASVIALNAVVGFIQEYKAAKIIDSLRSLASPTAKAIRSGKNLVVPSPEIVPGDVVEMSVGDTIPADVRQVKLLFLCHGIIPNN